MKKRKYILAVLLIGTALMCGCGKNGAEGTQASTGKTVESDASGESVPVKEESSSATAKPVVDDSETVKMNSIFTSGKNGIATQTGIQFFGEEEITLWCKAVSGAKDETLQHVYRFDSEGNGTRVVKNAPIEYTGQWFLTEEGYAFSYFTNVLTRIEPDGTVTYSVNVESGIMDICRLNDGRIILLTVSPEGIIQVAKLNAETGEYALVGNLTLGKDKRQFIAPYDNGLALVTSKGFYDVNLETGELTEIISMTEFSYVLKYTVKDFRLVGGGCAKMLTMDGIETILPKDPAKYRTVITISNPKESDWLKELINSFNENNYTYYVETRTEEAGAKLDEIAAQIRLEVEAGGGPDILTADTVDNPVYYMEQGLLDNFGAYMEETGVYIEDFFYAAFDSWKYEDGIYGADVWLEPEGLKVKSDLLLGDEIPNMEEFIEILQDYPENEALVKGWNGTDVLNYLLGASDSFFGMVDWEAGTCDFGGNLFAEILEMSKWYADDTVSELSAMGGIINTGWYTYEGTERLAMQEEIYLGYFFDEGNYTKVNPRYMLGVNGKSSNKEGAWEFIKYALSEEYQVRLYDFDTHPGYNRFIPMNLYAFDKVGNLEIKETAVLELRSEEKGRTIWKAGYNEMDRSEYKIRYSINAALLEEIKVTAENARCVPVEVEMVKEIILQETESFFAGEKSMDEVVSALQIAVEEFLGEYCNK